MASTRLRSSDARASSSRCASELGVDAGVDKCEPLDMRCLLDAGSCGVRGEDEGEGAVRCMNWSAVSIVVMWCGHVKLPSWSAAGKTSLSPAGWAAPS